MPTYTLRAKLNTLSVCLLGLSLALSGCKDAPSSANTAPTQSEATADTAPHGPTIYGSADYSALSAWGLSSPRVFVAPSLSQDSQNLLVETAERAAALLEAGLSPASAPQAPTSTTANSDAEAARKVLYQMYQSLPEPVTEALDPDLPYTTASELVQKYVELFSKIRPDQATQDITKLNEWLSQEAAELMPLAEGATNVAETIDFLGINEGTVVKSHDSDTAAVNQARVDVQWLSLFQKHLVDTAQQIGLQLQSLPDAATARASMPPASAWADFLATEARVLEDNFSQYPRSALPKDGRFSLSGSGYVVVEFELEGQKLYFAEGIRGSPVHIKRSAGH